MEAVIACARPYQRTSLRCIAGIRSRMRPPIPASARAALVIAADESAYTTLRRARVGLRLGSAWHIESRCGRNRSHRQVSNAAWNFRMRLSRSTSEADIRAALYVDARETWGAQRFEALRPTLDVLARSIWVVFQEPSDSADLPPDLRAAPRR